MSFLNLSLNDIKLNYEYLENNRIKPVDWTLEAKRRMALYYFIERTMVTTWLKKR